MCIPRFDSSRFPPRHSASQLVPVILESSSPRSALPSQPRSRDCSQNPLTSAPRSPPSLSCIPTISSSPSPSPRVSTTTSLPRKTGRSPAPPPQPASPSHPKNLVHAPRPACSPDPSRQPTYINQLFLPAALAAQTRLPITIHYIYIPHFYMPKRPPPPIAAYTCQRQPLLSRLKHPHPHPTMNSSTIYLHSPRVPIGRLVLIALFVCSVTSAAAAAGEPEKAGQSIYASVPAGNMNHKVLTV